MNNNGKGLAIAGMILGIVGIVFAILNGWFSVIGLPVAIVGLVLSVVGGKKLKAAGLPNGIGVAGLVLGIIAVVFATVAFFTCGLCVICATTTAAGLSSLV